MDDSTKWPAMYNHASSNNTPKDKPSELDCEFDPEIRGVKTSRYDLNRELKFGNPSFTDLAFYTNEDRAQHNFKTLNTESDLREPPLEISPDQKRDLLEQIGLHDSSCESSDGNDQSLFYQKGNGYSRLALMQCIREEGLLQEEGKHMAGKHESEKLTNVPLDGLLTQYELQEDFENDVNKNNMNVQSTPKRNGEKKRIAKLRVSGEPRKPLPVFNPFEAKKKKSHRKPQEASQNQPSAQTKSPDAAQKKIMT